jgi:hypothetical protein
MSSATMVRARPSRFRPAEPFSPAPSRAPAVVIVRLLAVARRDKSEPNPILTWPMLALGLD